MLAVDCETERHDGVTLVTAVVENEGPRRRVTFAAAGEVWPPRRRGVPESGWNGGEVTMVLAAGERRAVGYATPDDLVDPLSVVETERVSARQEFDPAVPVPSVDSTADGVVRALGDSTPSRAAVPSSDRGTRLAWLDAVESRVATAEALAAAGTLAEAADALDTVGGLSGARRLVEALEIDGEALARLRDRLAAVDERRAAVSIPMETFERLA